MLDEGKYRTTVQSMHKIGWKAQYFKSADVSMLGHGCGVSQYPYFYYYLYHKTEDIVKHQNHEPTLKHQQT